MDKDQPDINNPVDEEKKQSAKQPKKKTKMPTIYVTSDPAKKSVLLTILFGVYLAEELPMSAVNLFGDYSTYQANQTDERRRVR